MSGPLLFTMAPESLEKLPASAAKIQIVLSHISDGSLFYLSRRFKFRACGLGINGHSLRSRETLGSDSEALEHLSPGGYEYLLRSQY